MNKIYELIGRIISILFIIAGVVMTVIAMSNTDVLVVENLGKEVVNNIMNPYFVITAIALGFAALFAILFPLGGMINNPKAGLRLLISLAILGIIYFLAYSLADGNIDAEHFTENNIDEAGSKLIGSFIYLIYIVGGLAVFVTLFSGIFKLFNR